ncbi:NUDIX hydrolase [Campylobacter sp. MIT 12-8780]|uniref:NUDIX domain-containing protein n=1 Tax=unclassified Campylobacter TaxID=2593542 RepID=UPI0010F64F0C|nr:MULTISPECIES: NUDIX domain-containing protein [unclassified Campylobacter]NDJ27515.1 NUDIX domain-containing protein [Campylobacter sp. MIT 19-121]TKX28789.1 NUDIX hydrolase [Campylobacter sp. MIT 12-5580]TQR41271.1 NUDIX hydrolase [Campylobacter sp. MIT 12-8780]
MDISTLKQEEFKSSIYIKAKRFSYLKNGKKHTWDFIEALDSVSILLYHKEKQSFIFVRQFRVPLWDYQVRNNVNIDKSELGYSVELCSGLVDKNLSIEDIAKEECLEELGYLPKSLEKVADFYGGFGSGASKQSLFFAEVSEEDKKAEGGGIDDEEIQSVFVKVKEFEEFSKHIVRAASFEFAYLWFMKNKAQIYGL